MSWWYPIPAVTTTSRGYNADHLGIDFATVAPDPPLVPQPVYASSEGTVTQANDDGAASFGNVVVVTRPNGWRRLYGHLSRIDVTVGQVVAQGQQVGMSGGGTSDPGHGSSTGRHLHYQIMNGGGTNSQNTVDPAPLLVMPPIAGGNDVYVLISPDASQWVVVGDTQADGFVKEQLANLDKVLQVTARTQAEFDATLAKRKTVVPPPITISGGPNTGYTGTVVLTPTRGP